MVEGEAVVVLLVVLVAVVNICVCEVLFMFFWWIDSLFVVLFRFRVLT